MIRKQTDAEREAELQKKLVERLPPPYEPISDKLKEIRIDSRSLLAFASSQADLKKDKDGKNKNKPKYKRSRQSNSAKTKSKKGSDDEGEYYDNATFLKTISSKKSSEVSKRSKVSTKSDNSKKSQVVYKQKNVTRPARTSITSQKTDPQKMLISSSVSSISGDGRDKIDKPADYMQSSQVFDSNDTQSKEKITQSFESEYLGVEEIQPMIRELASSKASSNVSKKSSKKSESKNLIDDSKQFSPEQIAVIISDKKKDASPLEGDGEQMDLDGDKQNAINEELQQTSTKVARKAIVRKREEMPKEKVKYLFEFIYGMQGIPKRIGSANYVLPYKTSEPNEQKETYKSESLLKIPHETTHEMSNSKYFDDWLKNYEFQKMKSNMRQLNASRQANLILNQNINRWSECISKKIINSKPPSAQINKFKNSSPLLFRNEPIEVRPSISAGNRSADKENLRYIVERNAKSAYISAKLSDTNELKRPKTVSFTVNSNNKTSSSNEMNETKAERAKPAISVRVQPTYLVSSIEMEEILQESEKRVRSVQSERSRKSNIMQMKSFEKNFDIIRQKNTSNVSFADIVDFLSINLISRNRLFSKYLVY